MSTDEADDLLDSGELERFDPKLWGVLVKVATGELTAAQAMRLKERDDG